MRSFTCPRFWRRFRSIPEDVQRQARKSYSYFKDNPRHPSLRFKQISRAIRLWSASVDQNYRAMGAVDGDEIMWFWIGPHDEYIRKINDPNIARSVEIARENLADRRSKR